jgi:hypothetical protein
LSSDQLYHAKHHNFTTNYQQQNAENPPKATTSPQQIFFAKKRIQIDSTPVFPSIIHLPRVYTPEV